MASRVQIDDVPASIVPIDNETHAMLDYAQGAGAQSRFAEARRELQDGEGITPSAEYFDDLNRRISQRAKQANSNKEA